MFASAITSLVVLAAALNPVLAGIYITNPVAGTSATGGQVLTVKWADDGNTPTLASIGPCSIDIYTGSKSQQTQLQNLAASVDVSKASSVSATVDATIGQNGEYYFVRFTSLALKDTTNSAYNYEAFSAIFSMSGMTGTFNSTILAQLAATGSASSAAASITPAAGSTTAGSSKASTTASTSATAPKSAAFPRYAAPASLVAGVIGLVSYLVL